MFDFRPKNAPLRRYQKAMFNKRCKRCNVSLSILSRNGTYCDKCKKLVKAERNAQKRQNTILKALK